MVVGNISLCCRGPALFPAPFYSCGLFSSRRYATSQKIFIGFSKNSICLFSLISRNNVPGIWFISSLFVWIVVNHYLTKLGKSQCKALFVLFLTRPRARLECTRVYHTTGYFTTRCSRICTASSVRWNVSRYVCRTTCAIDVLCLLWTFFWKSDDLILQKKKPAGVQVIGGNVTISSFLKSSPSS